MEIIIYKIYCKNNEIKDCYIGSTTNIKSRIGNHKSKCNNENSKEYNQYKYIYIRENGGWDNWEYKIICKCPKADRYKMERWYIENCKESNLNKCIPTRTNKEDHKEYRKKNKDKLKEYIKEYQNKDKYNEYQKNYRKENKEKISKYQKEYDKKIKEKRKQKMTCICGSVFRIDTKSKHCRSLKHQKYIENNQTI